MTIASASYLVSLGIDVDPRVALSRLRITHFRRDYDIEETTLRWKWYFGDNWYQIIESHRIALLKVLLVSPKRNALGGYLKPTMD